MMQISVQYFLAETQLGAGLLLICKQYQQSDNPDLQLIARILAPRKAVSKAPESNLD